MTDDIDIDPAETPLSEWLGRLAEAHGAPGGGAASAVMAAIAAALLGMVAGYTRDDPEAQHAGRRLDGIRRASVQAAEDDGIRSAQFGAALALDEGAKREAAVREATVDAIASSLDVGLIAAPLVDEVQLLARIGNSHVEADLQVAIEALRAALAGAVATAQANLALLTRHRAPDDGLDARVESLEAGVDRIMRARAALDGLAARSA